jgi:hypothetical protein
MPEELLERADLHEAPVTPEENLVPPVPPEGLDTALYELDERAARADLRRQIALMELALARLFGSAFPRKGINFSVPGMGGPRLLAVDELEQVRDSLIARIQEVRRDLHDFAVAEQANRELIEEMTADPASHKWVRVYNEDIGDPGCKNWHAKPKWGLLGMLLGWWRVKISSGCPLAEGPRPPESRWRRSDSAASDGGDRMRAPRQRRPSPLRWCWTMSRGLERRAAGRPPVGPWRHGAAFRSPRSSSSSAWCCWSSGSSCRRRRAS